LLRVVSDAKPFASLSSGMLARKGAARPAMRPQRFGQMDAGLDADLGCNDMGFAPLKPVVTPIREADHDAFSPAVLKESLCTGLAPPSSPICDQQVGEIAGSTGGFPQVGGNEDKINGSAELASARRKQANRRATDTNGRVAFTLRLDPERLLKLRLARAVTGRSARQLVTDALDDVLGSMPELNSLAERVLCARRQDGAAA
jgi:hypothetical protein